MNRFRGLLFFAFILVVSTLYGFVNYQNTQIDRKQLREMLVQMGFEVKDIVTDPGKEKYSVVFTKDGLDIPVGYEISPSGKYMWLTVNLGEAPAESATKNFALLKQDAKVQPCQFYVTESGRLMMALPVWNRNLTTVDLRQQSDSISDNVGKTKEVWQKQE